MERKEKLKKERVAMILTLSEVERKCWSLFMVARPAQKESVPVYVQSVPVYVHTQTRTCMWL